MATDDESALNYTPIIPFNTTRPPGGDSLIEDLNVHYEVCRFPRRWSPRSTANAFPQSGDIAWMLASTALVLLMIPGVG